MAVKKAIDWREEAYRVEAEAAVLMDWDLAPENVRKVAEESRDEGIPTMICIDERFGWCVLCTAGQGPCFDYIERDPEEPRKDPWTHTIQDE